MDDSMKKNRFQSLLATAQSLPDVDNLPSANSDDEDGSLRYRPKTGAVASSYMTNLEMKSEALERQLAEARSQNAAVRIPLDKVQPNPWQPRLVFTEESLTSLEDSIRASGVLQPIAVRSHPVEEGVYQLIAGERRTRAARAVGFAEIPAVILELSDADMAAQALTENVVRENLTDYEIGIALIRMQSEFPTKVDMANTFGINRTSLYRLLSFEKLPPVILDKLADKPSLISAAACYELVKYTSDNQISEETANQLIQDLELGLDITDIIHRLKKQGVPQNAPSQPRATKRQLFVGRKKVGVIDVTDSFTTIKLKTELANNEKREQLILYMKSLFPEIEF